MGFAKRAMEEAEERLFWPTYEQVCLAHLSDGWLRAHVVRSKVRAPCAACEADTYDAVELDSLLDIIAETIRCHWGLAIEELFFDRESPSGYALVPDPPTTEDLVRDEMYGDMDDVLLDVAAPRFIEEQWFDRGQIWLLGTELLTFGWETFSRWAMSATDPLEHDLKSVDPLDVNEQADGIAPERMMGRVLGIVDDLGLVISDERHWFRAVHLPPGEPVTASRVGTVPSLLATRPNRMSPAGVAMFYGAADRATALAEVGPPVGALVPFTGEWAPTRPLRLLDLTGIPTIPSFYDTEHQTQREVLLFLQRFVKDISKPVSPVASSVEYRPTQALTAFMRDHVGDLDGLLYRSSLTDEVCCTLFVDNAGCVDAAGAPDGSLRMVLAP